MPARLVAKGGPRHVRGFDSETVESLLRRPASHAS
jgi:hypothetical protein